MTGVGDARYEADVRWTAHGVPHIRAADWGSLVHEVAKDFVSDWMKGVPSEPEAAFMHLAERHLAARAARPGLVALWRPRLATLAPWFAESGQIFVRCASLVAVWAFAMMLLHYPTPLRGAAFWTRASAALLAGSSVFD